MIPYLAMLFMGWPAIIGSLALSSFGVVRGKVAWIIGGAVLCIGFGWYLTGWVIPVIRVLGYILPLLHLSATVAVSYRKPWIAWILLAPHAFIALFLAAIVLSQ